MSYYRIRKVYTNTLLEASDAYESDWIEVRQFDRLTGLVFSDEGGSLVIEQSIDGVNADFANTTVTVTGGTGEEFDFKVYGEYFKATYTNGGANQGAFRLAIYATPMG